MQNSCGEGDPPFYGGCMKRPLFLLMLFVVATQHVQTQTGIGGTWRAASVVPDGTPDGTIREFFLELKADGSSLTGTVTGLRSRSFCG